MLQTKELIEDIGSLIDGASTAQMPMLAQVLIAIFEREVVFKVEGIDELIERWKTRTQQLGTDPSYVFEVIEVLEKYKDKALSRRKKQRTEQEWVTDGGTILKPVSLVH